MPSVSNVTLRISRLNDNQSRVTVSWRVCFSNCEAVAGSAFIERVQLRGDDLLIDDDLGPPLSSQCVKAQPGCVNKSITRTVSNGRLDEDRDTIILGVVIGAKDEIYARLTYSPFIASGTSADSNTVSEHFGPAG